MDDLREDIEELEVLRKQAKRARNLSLLDKALYDLREEVAANAGQAGESDPAPQTNATPTIEIPEAPSAPSKVVKPPPANPSLPAGMEFIPITTFGWDSGEYNSPWVCVYITLEGVGSVKDAVECTFAKDGFDLTVKGLKGKNYRLLKDNLEHDIIPNESKRIVKRDRVTIKLKKVKGEYSYETWQNLTAKKNKAEKQKKKDDPMGGIMDMMKDMYDSGDDQMKKVIGEAMLKSKTGGGAGAFDDKGGLGDIGNI